MNKYFLSFLLIFFVSGCASTKESSLTDLETLQKQGESKTAEVAAPSTQEKTEEKPKPKFSLPVGEYMKFSIRWLGLEVGTAEVRIKEIVEIQNRDAYHIEVLVRSNKLIDIIWPVRDEHHSYMDVEHFHSLRYEKKISEGPYRADEYMEYDQMNHMARYTSKRSGDVKEMLIPENVQDQLSCTFWFRAQEMKEGDVITIPVNADEKNWDLEVHVEQFEDLEIEGFGKVKAVKVEPMASFQGMFVRRGRAWGWMSVGEHRIPLLMKAKVPKLGTVNMVIIEYKQDDIHIKAK